MSSLPTSGGSRPLNVPDSLQRKLRRFRDRLWTVKVLEAVLVAVGVACLCFLTVYALDRLVDTPRTARLAILACALAVGLLVPRAIHRWVWGHRRLDQLARLLRARHPSLGDPLLSVIELARDLEEQSRSPALCAAAMQQVAGRAAQHDLNAAVPAAHLRFWGTTSVAAASIVWGLFALYPDASRNALQRLLAAGHDVPRYTFTRPAPLPPVWIVPHGEPASIEVRLAPDSRWRPQSARLRVEGYPPVEAGLEDGRYRFALPPLTSAALAELRVGDFYRSIEIAPTLRPELVRVEAQTWLPEYLERPDPPDTDVRSGAVAAVRGSRVVVRGEISREVQSVWIGEHPISNANLNRFSTLPLDVDFDAPRDFQFRWLDHLGLEGGQPFSLTIEPVEDEPPTVVAQDLPKQAVVLDTEQLNFRGLAADDFGVRRIGMEWRSLEESSPDPVLGQRVLSAGGPENTSMQVAATFCAANLGLGAQPVELRLWAEDYFPDRPREYSAPHILFVLTADQHAVWIAEQLNQWQRASLDVRDQELRLHEKNKQLRNLAPEQLAQQERRAELQRQAALESANARQLHQLSRIGADLIRRATRNPQIPPQQLERWAEMLRVLEDIGNNRMPGVAELLEQAAGQPVSGAAAGSPETPSPPPVAGTGASTNDGRGAAPGERTGEPQNASESPSSPSPAGAPQSDAAAADDAQPQGPVAGQNRSGASAGGKPSEAPPGVALPTISDVESTMQPGEGPETAEEPPSGAPADAPRLSLPGTAVIGPPSDAGSEPGTGPSAAPPPALQQALFEQEALLTEFQKVSDELNQLLAGMEGSTLVKRLKSAARDQQQIADRLASRIGEWFGASQPESEADRALLDDLSDRENEAARTVSYIMDDIQSYYERRRMGHFKQVLAEMRALDVLMALRRLSEDLQVEFGLSIAQAEFWADTLDRWAEDLIAPAEQSESDSDQPSEEPSPPPDAVPPRLIVEVLKILEGEVNLREDTRVAQQSQPVVAPSDHLQASIQLSGRQSDLRERIGAVVAELAGLPRGAERFPDEIELMSVVGTVMDEAASRLSQGETGSETIAAETEVIELLLQSKRINPRGAAGGGSSPGGGGTGTTEDSALALLGSGLNQSEYREHREVTQATGQTGPALPEEFRAGLDAYFEQIEEALR